LKHVLIFLLLTNIAAGATYYCDAAAAGTGNAGTEGDPFSEADLTDLTQAWDLGDTIYCKGSFGTIDVLAQEYGNVGTGHTTWSAWPGFTPDANVVQIRDTNYLKFDGWNLDAGWADAEKMYTINFSQAGADEIYFKDCNIYGTRRINPSFGDFFPYYHAPAYGGVAQPYVIYVNTAAINDVTIDGCTFRHGFNFLELKRNSTWIIKNSTFHRSGGNAGINSGGDYGTDVHITVQDCTFYDFKPYYGLYSYLGTETAGDWDNLSAYETITFSTGATGIFWSWTGTYVQFWADDENNLPTAAEADGTTITRDSDPSNYIFTKSGAVQQAHNDCIVFPNDAGRPDNPCIIERCLFYNCHNDFLKSEGAENSDPNFIFRNNVCWTTEEGTADLDKHLLIGGGDVEIYNNIFISEHVGQIAFQISSNAQSSIVVNNIISYVNTACVPATTTVGYNIFMQSVGDIDDDLEGTGDIYGQDFADIPAGNNRYFTDFTNNDYSVYNSSSPQVGTASAMYAPSDDFIGTVRPQGGTDDIGAYEFIQNSVFYLFGVYQ